ncbi:MAG: RNA-binding protein [Spirochaetales bacterium]|nr:RNA-binding protein [Spirochaetales bacterium]
MSNKIYVGNLSYNVDESKLTEIFSAYGEILSAKIIEDRDTGRSKGFAFVEMANESEKQSAISGLNGKEVDGRNLKVNEANDRPPRNNNYRNNY